MPPFGSNTTITLMFKQVTVIIAENLNINQASLRLKLSIVMFTSSNENGTEFIQYGTSCSGPVY